MCDRCDYVTLIEAAGLSPLPNRLQVIERIGNSPAPLSAQELHESLRGVSNLNRVTLYRILDLLVQYRLVERMSSGGRSYRYDLAANPNHPRHPHFYCTRCGRMECLEPGNLDLDLTALGRSIGSRIDRVELRLDGICRSCLSDSSGERPR